MMLAGPGSSDTLPQTEQTVTFRRLEYTSHPATFWGNLITSAGGSNGKKAVMQLERAEIPADVMANATPAQLNAAGVEAAHRSVMAFMRFVDTVRNPRAAAERQKILMLEMKYVGIKCEGRSGPYDLMYFPHTNKIYAADSRDDGIVYVLA
jgi:hypothetical protein